MLSYQHAYHAGGAADLHKHAALAVLLRLLTVKARGISYLESHAGRALYDLAGVEALKTREAAAGIGRLDQGSLPDPLAGAVAAVRAAHGPTAYPGSPAIAATMLRAQDRLTLCERHPAEHAALKAAMAGLARGDGPSVAIHARNGHEGLLALSPPKLRRGLALIDPSYEVKTEYAEVVATARALLSRWAEAVLMVWYPILPDGRHGAMADTLGRLPRALRHEAMFVDPPSRGMVGSGIVIANPPYATALALSRGWDALDAVFECRWV